MPGVLSNGLRVSFFFFKSLYIPECSAAKPDKVELALGVKKYKKIYLGPDVNYIAYSSFKSIM